MAGSTTTYNVAGIVTGLADAALAEFIRVKITATGYAVAALADRADGITQEAIASGAYGPIKLLSGADTNFGTATAATIAAGVPVFSAAGGALSTTGATGSFAEGVSITAAGASEIFEWRYKPSSVAES